MMSKITTTRSAKTIDHSGLPLWVMQALNNLGDPRTLKRKDWRPILEELLKKKGLPLRNFSKTREYKQIVNHLKYKSSLTKTKKAKTGRPRGRPKKVVSVMDTNKMLNNASKRPKDDLIAAKTGVKRAKSAVDRGITVITDQHDHN